MREWHRGLTEKQRRFVEAYAGNGGNGTQAATVAGYRKPHPQGAQNLRKPTIQQSVELLRLETTTTEILNREQRQLWWSKIMGDEQVDMHIRLKASELLGKSQGDFIERRELSVGVMVSKIVRVIVE